MQKIRLSNHSLAYKDIRTANPVSDTIIIFLHEALGSIGQWKSFPVNLCHSLRLNGFVYERRGHGNSDALDVPRTERYLHDYTLELTELIETVFSQDQKFILVGHSDGGTIALLYASRFPEKLKGVITMAAHGFIERETLDGIAPAVKAFEEGKLEGLNKYHGEKTTELFYAWAHTWNSSAFSNWDIIDELNYIDCPGLLLQGDRDQYGTDKQIERLASCFKNEPSTKLLADCGHHPHLEKEELCLTLMSEWINKLKAL